MAMNPPAQPPSSNNGGDDKDPTADFLGFLSGKIDEISNRIGGIEQKQKSHDGVFDELKKLVSPQKTVVEGSQPPANPPAQPTAPAASNETQQPKRRSGAGLFW